MFFPVYVLYTLKKLLENAEWYRLKFEKEKECSDRKMKIYDGQTYMTFHNTIMFVQVEMEKELDVCFPPPPPPMCILCTHKKL